VFQLSSGFCYVTFSEHTAPVTAVAFLPSGSAVLSASLDGSVRAYDLLRYRWVCVCLGGGVFRAKSVGSLGDLVGLQALMAVCGPATCCATGEVFTVGCVEERHKRDARQLQVLGTLSQECVSSLSATATQLLPFRAILELYIAVVLPPTPLPHLSVFVSSAGTFAP
jgi:hypothetical protein